MSVSVCMATYNGGKYIREQIFSILCQLNDCDELIIVDDNSNDNTMLIINEIKDKRIKLFCNKTNNGVNFSFGLAMSLSNNSYLFLCDQDDVWLEGKVNKMCEALSAENVLLVTSNSLFINDIGNEIEYPYHFKQGADSNFRLKNLIKIFLGKGNYPGCAMAFKKELLNIILPIPKYVESHDLWIAKAANLLGANYHLEAKTFKRRIHGANFSLYKRNFSRKIWSRVIFAVSVSQLLLRILKQKMKAI